MDLSSAARAIFRDAMRAVALPEVLHRKFRRGEDHLGICELDYDLSAFQHIVVLAVGKAAVPMAEGLLATLDQVPALQAKVEGLVVGATLPEHPDARLRYRLGSHPLPDSRAPEAADLALALLSRCDRATLVFFLISGGSSAMLERPLTADVSLAELAQFHQALVHSGLNIAEINTLRKHLSAVKGGRLAAAAGEATMCTVLVSDVRPGRPEVIGSGPSLPDPTTISDCRALLSGPLAGAFVPAAVRHWFFSPACPETPKPWARCFLRARHVTLLSSDDLVDAAASAAQQLGFEVKVDLSCDEWDYRSAAEYLVHRLQQLVHRDCPVCLISAGELAVHVTGTPGRGGRNQQFALLCAQRIAGATSDIAVLSAGSDGVDGNSPAAGAVVDRDTVRRAADLGLDVVGARASFNAFPLLDGLGQTVVTGPTGNNLRDLRLLLIEPRGAGQGVG